MMSKFLCLLSLLLAFVLAGCDSFDTFHLASVDPTVSQESGSVA
jgi:hypothetical protein